MDMLPVNAHTSTEYAYLRQTAAASAMTSNAYPRNTRSTAAARSSLSGIDCQPVVGDGPKL